MLLKRLPQPVVVGGLCDQISRGRVTRTCQHGKLCETIRSGGPVVWQLSLARHEFVTRSRKTLDMSYPAVMEPVRTEYRIAKRRLRLAVVTETFPPEVNGVAQTIAKVVQGLHLEGHELTLIRPNQVVAAAMPSDYCFREVLVAGVPIPRYGQLRMGLPAMHRLTTLWRAQRPDVVHIVTEGPLGLSALIAARRLGIPVCSEFRTNFHSYCAHYGFGWLARPIIGYLRWFHNRTRCTMVPTSGLAAELGAKGFANLRVVARGVDTRLFDPAKRCQALRDSWGAAPNSLVVIYVGRLASEKNLSLLCYAFEKIRRERPESRLVFVGDGPSRKDLEQCCPDAIFAGNQRGNELARHYASGDLFLFSSLTETFGNVTPEAMASGLAVVSYDHAAAGELILSGVNGVLARRGDEIQFLEMAAQLARRSTDLAGMRHRARQSVSHLNWPRIIEDIETVYTTLD